MPEISQEKSKERLAEIYEREFIEEKEREEARKAMTSNTVQKATEVDESEAQKEFNRLYEKQLDKLDNLSSPKVMELDVSNKNVKAVTLEDMMPDGTIDEDVMVSKEAFTAEKKESKGEV